MTGVHRLLHGSLNDVWSEMASHQEVVGSFEHVSFEDAVTFVALMDKTRRTLKKKTSVLGKDLHESLCKSMTKFLAGCIRKEARRLLSEVPNILSRSIPSRALATAEQASNSSPQNQMVPFNHNDAEHDHGNPTTRSRKSWVKVDVNSIWELYRDALETGVSLPILARTRRKDQGAGMSEETVHYWLRKIANIYAQRAALCMSSCRFFNIACDASRHATRDTLVSTMFSVENQVGLHANAQVIKAGGKMLAPGEAILDDEMEELAATRQIERCASWRLMQAISFQIKYVTKGQKTLSSFHLDDSDPIAIATRPLSPDFVRIVRQTENGKQIHIHDKRTKTTTLLDLSSAKSKPVLSLIMDQGPCGTAFAAFLAGHGCNMLSFGAWQVKSSGLFKGLFLSRFFENVFVFREYQFVQCN